MSTSKVLLLTLVCLPLVSSAQAKETPVRIYDTAKQKLMHENFNVVWSTDCAPNC